MLLAINMMVKIKIDGDPFRSFYGLCLLIFLSKTDIFLNIECMALKNIII